jgi:branched-chain amino acid transport system substrate-binding protein
MIAMALAATACGNRSSSKDLAALLKSGAQTPATEAAPPGASPAPAESAAPAEAATPSDAGSVASGTAAPSASPSASGAVKPSGSGSSPATPKSAAGTAGGGGKNAAAAGSASGSGSTGASGATGSGAATGGPSAAAPTPGAPTPAAPKGCAGNEAPLVIGSVGTLSGVVGYLFTPGIVAIQSWVADTNAKGGINCHKVKYIQGDDGGDPARHQSIIKNFVEQEKVVSFVFNPAPFSGQSSADYLNQKGVPVLGQEGGQLFFYDSPMHFPIYANGDMMQANEVYQASKVFLPQGKKKVGTISCTEAEYCNLFDKTAAEIGKKVGFEVVFQAKATLTAPDYTSNCIQARNQGVEALITSLDAQTNHRLAASCAKVGVKVPLASASLQGSYDYADDPNMEGTVIGMNTRPWFSSEIPSIATYLSALKTYARGKDAIPGPGSINGWTDAKAFEHAAKGIAPNAVPTPKDIVNGLYAFNGNDLDGLTYPLRFAAGQAKKKIACGYPVVTGKGGKFTTEPKMSCLPGYEP